MSVVTYQGLTKLVDPDRAPLQFAILQYLSNNCCMNASISLVRDGMGLVVSLNEAHATVGSRIIALKKKGLVVEYNGRYHYFRCDRI